MQSHQQQQPPHQHVYQHQRPQQQLHVNRHLQKQPPQLQLHVNQRPQLQLDPQLHPQQLVNRHLQ
jgi:hypothetical protein